MSLTLHYHPLSSFCWKVLIALYENETKFTPHIVDLGNAESRAAFLALWPIGKFPVLRDETRKSTVPESTIVIEYLAQHYPGRIPLLPGDPDRARQARLQDRFFDLHLHMPLQQVVGDRLRPADKRDPYGVEQAKRRIHLALDMIDADMAAKASAGQDWAMGEVFTLVDCAAMPALHYADKVLPFASSHPNATAYLNRLKQRPSVARVLTEAEPYAHLFPQEK
jgi:glutathione S-transferase